MGLLDDLKKKADLVKTQQDSAHTVREEAIRRVEDCMKQSFQYFHELLSQLAVLKPVNPMSFVIPGVGDLKDMQLTETFIDSRKKRLADRDVYDYVSFYLKWASPAGIVVERDMPNAAQKIRDALFANNVKFAEEEVKNDRRVTVKWKFTIETAVVTDVTIVADHEADRLVVNGKNLIRLGSDDFIVPAAEVGEAWLDEFAKTMLGEPTNFRRYRGLAPARH